MKKKIFLIGFAMLIVGLIIWYVCSIQAASELINRITTVDEVGLILTGFVIMLYGWIND